MDLDYLSAILGFGVQGFLFSWHLHGRSEIDVQVKKNCSMISYPYLHRNIWIIYINSCVYSCKTGVNLTVQDILRQDARIRDLYFNISINSYQSHRCTLYLMPLGMTLFGMKTATRILDFQSGTAHQAYFLTFMDKLLPITNSYPIDHEIPILY